jgi:hypothetical protein
MPLLATPPQNPALSDPVEAANFHAGEQDYGNLTNLLREAFAGHQRSGRAVYPAWGETGMHGSVQTRLVPPFEKVTQGERVSTIITDLAKHKRSAASLVGLNIASAADFASALHWLRSPLRERFGVAIVDSHGQVIHAVVLAIGSLEAERGSSMLVGQGALFLLEQILNGLRYVIY